MRVVGYVRLSRDEDKESYSSILSQKSIIEEYALQHNWTVSKYYEDDNCSGYSFDRPAFNELIKAMEKHSIDIIIAKDLSRIGRHNAYTLLFLDKIKRLNKRLILPKEGRGYDTVEDESDLLGITTWYNEMYVKDISRKIKSSMKAKQKEGNLIIKEVFGYKRSLDNKHRLEIDLEAAEIVQNIFKLYLSGIGYRKIAEVLNQQKCPTPSQYHMYKEEGLLKRGNIAELWNSVHVQRILKNDIYIGTLRLGKTEKKVIKGKSQKIPQDMQYIFENNHPAIVSIELFKEVQKISEGRKKNHNRGAASLHNIFAGLIFCQNCGSYMITYKKQGKAKSYICGNYHKYGRQSCMRHTVQEDVLQESVKECLKALAVEYSEEIRNIQIETENNMCNNNHQLINILLQEQQQRKKQLRQLIMQKTIGMEKENSMEYQNIINDSFAELEKEIKQRLLYADRRIKELQQELQAADESIHPDPYELLIGMINKPLLEKKYVEILIDKILIDSDGSPTIYMKVDFEALCSHNREAANLVPDL
ncbi:MAG: hypothetical protein A2Y23_14835 [Clostridiales bacterium GWB2_37_7]|nr:MAG: hypothetical protein A2Y23_14835 [Clostridiales bacterium GWB2_37_7]